MGVPQFVMNAFEPSMTHSSSSRRAVVRAAAYEATADALVDTDGRTVHQVVDAVLEVYAP